MTAKSGSCFDITNPWKVDTRVKDKLEGTFFKNLVEMTLYRQRLDFLSFIRSCYSPTSKTFTFGNQIELYFGLEDVYCISGIPVDGVPVVCDGEPTEILCVNRLGKCQRDRPQEKKKKVNKQWLRENFEKVPIEISKTDPALNNYVRAYLLYLVGCFIVPDCDNSSEIPSYYLNFIDGLTPKELNGVAWGAAAWVSLIHMLNSDRKNVHGPTWMLELFFLERIRKIRKAYMNLAISNPYAPRKERLPLLYRWCPLMVNPGKNTSKKLTNVLNNIRKKMESGDISWQPYKDYEGYHRQRMFFSRVVLFNFNQISYHEPEKGACQLLIRSLQPVEKQIDVESVSLQKLGQKQLLSMYEPHIKMWNDRYRESLCIRDLAGTFKLPPSPDEYVSDEEESIDINAKAAGEEGKSGDGYEDERRDGYEDWSCDYTGTPTPKRSRKSSPPPDEQFVNITPTPG